MRILTVDLGARTPPVVHTVLRQVASSYDIVHDAERGLLRCQQSQPSVAVVCVDQSGEIEADFARELRRAETPTPLLVIAGRARAQDMVRTLDSGADDYLPGERPPTELAARARALARREPALMTDPISLGSLRLEPFEHRVWMDDRELALPPVQFALLEALMRHPGRALSRNQLIGMVWDPGAATTSNVVDQAIAGLRRSIGRERISTVRNVGYRLESA